MPSIALPTHLGFIVDGNRRWAREHGLPTLEGHTKGFHKVELIAEETLKRGVKFATFYLFSTENWQRSPEEVAYLMNLVRDNVVKMIDKFAQKNIRCVVLGRPEPVDPDIWQKLMDAEERTASCTGGTLAICFNYGGQQEIADAVSKIVADRATTVAQTIASDPSGLEAAITTAASVTTADITAHLYHPEVPPVDLIVRTSGEERISGFMLWRAAYSEFLFLPKYFPDIELSDLNTILTEFASRQRRFGK